MNEFAPLFEKLRANRWNIARTTALKRVSKLKKLKAALLAHRGELQKAIFDDFRKNPGEVDLTEVYPAIAEINHAIRHLATWMKPQPVTTPLVLFGTHSAIQYEPKGVVLILSPWNYPFQLLMAPLIAAIAAGNSVVLKPSAKTPHTAHFMKKFIADLFPEDEIVLLEGDHQVADRLLELPFDHIFFTGSPEIGKKVMTMAARHLASVTLELGGKSPVIVDDTADIKKAAERVVWGKFINAGQTCVAPDYLLIDEKRLTRFVAEAKKVIAHRYGDSEGMRRGGADFCRLVSEGHLERLKNILEESIRKGAKIEFGGEIDPKERYLSPTLLTGVTNESPIMKEEIFGPILPILTYRHLDEAIQIIQKREKPLALYLFSKAEKNIDQILNSTSAGGTCINSLIIHLANPDLPFGGVGQSGMGNYHGFFGFRTFSHERAVLRQGAIDLLRLFYPPYTPWVRRLIRWTIRFF
ncbi:MAG: aldehyde dehydrogenase family protein [Deltaproteobacteria bacterium]|nr:aldehyde dehydrogenase family protein [Deltaproteobacteria bacterium]MBI4374370.1 aldehyde dehydrogenase family protein [Deltaproteobacteria bacterium]